MSITNPIIHPTTEQFERRVERLLNRAYHAKKNYSHYKIVAGDVGQLADMQIFDTVATAYSEKFHQEFITIMDCYMIMTGEGFTDAHVKLLSYSNKMNRTDEDGIDYQTLFTKKEDSYLSKHVDKPNLNRI